MTLEDVLELIERLNPNEATYYCGFLNAKEQRSLGIYQGMNIGRIEALARAKDVAVKTVRLLIHWSDDSIETEQVAKDLHEALNGCGQVEMDGYVVDYLDLAYEEPVDVGQDAEGIFERVIEMTIYYRKKGE